MSDDERLSALFEGKVVGREREELLAHLAASDDDYEVFADMAEVLRALEKEDAPAGETPALEPEPVPLVPEPVRAEEPEGALAETSGVIPFRRREPARPRPAVQWGWIAAAAVILAFSVLALQGRGRVGPQPVQLASRLEGGLPPEWEKSEPWVAERGATSARDRNVRAARAGVMMVWLAAAVQAHDSAQTQTIAARLLNRSDRGASPDTPLQKIRAQPNARPDSLRTWLEQATTRLEMADKGGYLRVAAWAEAARVAAHQQNAGFFRAEDAAPMLDRAERLAGADAVQPVRDALPAAARPTDWAALETSLKAFLEKIAS